MKSSNNKKITLTNVMIVAAIIVVIVAFILELVIVANIEEFKKYIEEQNVIDFVYLIALLIGTPIVLLVTVIVIFKRIRENARALYRYQRHHGSYQLSLPNELLVEGTGSIGSSKASDKNNKNISRFSILKQIDKKRETYSKDDYINNITLEMFCDDFRNYSANELGLYYRAEDIRSFISGLGVSHILILQGMSGTGKTSLAYAFGRFVENPSTVIPIQPMWKERTDLIGYYNEFTKHFNETALLKKMYEANYSEDIYITVLDEMNIARVEYYFAEFLSLLELPRADERYMEVVSDKWATDPASLKDGQIQLPTNMWFIGTANNDDSTFAISDKVYDRAMILNLDNKCEPFRGRNSSNLHLSAKDFDRLILNAQQENALTERNKEKLKELDNYLTKHFQVTFGNRIMMQINKYVPIYIGCGGEELDALDDILSKKILRKLEMKNPIYVKNGADGLVDKLNELFGEEAMPRCKQYIRNIVNNI